MTSITFRLEDDEKSLLQYYADQNDVSVSWIVRRAIKEFIANKAKENNNENRNNLLTESNGSSSEDGTYPNGSNAES